jgi:catechol 2,3-dioxygenase|tara:strand:+ start:127 stop:714 length:588 start_codon:yes stop_codon:yes gene_type:complete
MARGIIDRDGLRRADIRKLYEVETPGDVPFAARKISHVVLKVADLERSVHFYSQVMGFRVSDAYPETMMPGRMAFLRCNDDHHGIALVGGGRGPSENRELHHFAFEVDSLDEVFQAREHLKSHGVEIDFEGRRRAGQQIALEFSDPDGHRLEICWGMDRLGPDDRSRPPEQWREAFSLEDAVRDAPKGQDTEQSD